LDAACAGWRFYRAFFDDAGLAVAKAALARILVSHVPTHEPSTPTAGAMSAFVTKLGAIVFALADVLRPDPGRAPAAEAAIKVAPAGVQDRRDNGAVA